MALNLRENPKWLAAVAREREIRESAYLGLRTPVFDGAIMLAPLTLRQQATLFAARNPIVYGGTSTDAEAVAFLWALHPDFDPENLMGREAYFAELRELDPPWDQVSVELRAYYVEQTLDSPKPAKIQRSTEHAAAVSGPAVYLTELWRTGAR